MHESDVPVSALVQLPVRWDHELQFTALVLETARTKLSNSLKAPDQHEAS